METEVKVTCLLCKKLVDSINCGVLDESLREMLSVLSIKIKIKAADQQSACNDCIEKLRSVFDFKSSCLHTERWLEPYFNCENEEKVDIKSIFINEMKHEKLQMDADMTVCRLCRSLCCSESAISLTKLLEEHHYFEVFQEHFKELALQRTINPVMCKECSLSLQNLCDFIFLVSCFDYEGQERNVKEGEGRINRESQLPIISGTSSCNGTKKYVSGENNLKPISSLFKSNNRVDNILIENDKEDGNEFFKDDLIETNDEKTECSVNEPMNSPIKREIKEEIQEDNIECGEDEVPHGEFEFFDIKNETIDIKSEDSESNIYDTDPLQTRSPRKRNVKKETKNFACHICSFQTNVKWCMQQHTLIHRSPSQMQMYKCPKCKFETKKKFCLERHMITHKNFSEVKLLQCQKCDYKAKARDTLMKHIERTHDVKIHTCHVCRFETKYRFTYNEHMKLHQIPFKAETHKCNMCSFVTTRRSYLLKHKRLLHKDPNELKWHKCEICSYETRQQKNLKKHSLLHRNSDEIPMHKCVVCSFETKTKEYLARHVIIHKDVSEVKMQKCHLCPFQTKYRRSLKRHSSMVHGL